METYLIVLIGLGILLLFAVVAILYQAKKMEELIDLRWQELWLTLYFRHNVLPNLLETFRGYLPEEKKVFKELIDLKEKAIHLNNPDKDKLAVELDLSLKIRELMDKARSSKDLSTDTNFLELKHELKENSFKVEAALAIYNDKIHDYQEFLAKGFVKPVAKVFRMKSKHIFEYEAAV